MIISTFEKKRDDLQNGIESSKNDVCKEGQNDVAINCIVSKYATVGIPVENIRV